MKKSHDNLTLNANEVSKMYGISRQTVLNKMKKLGTKKVTKAVLKECQKVVEQKNKIDKIVDKSNVHVDKNVVKRLKKEFDSKATKNDKPSKTNIKLSERLAKARDRYVELYEYYNQLIALQKTTSLFTTSGNGTAQSPILDKIAKYAQLLNQTDDTITKLEEKLGIAATEEDSDPTKAPKEFMSV